MAYQASLCSGCGHPRHETFDPSAEDRYDATALQCHACAARDRKAYNRSAGRDADQLPPFGEYFAVTRSDD